MCVGNWEQRSPSPESEHLASTTEDPEAAEPAVAEKPIVVAVPEVVTAEAEVVAVAAAAKGNTGGALDEADECVICHDAPKTHAFVPCGHQCVCGPCAELVMNSTSLRIQRPGKCPVCRKAVLMKMEIFK